MQACKAGGEAPEETAGNAAATVDEAMCGIEEALLNRARGYEYTEQVVKEKKDVVYENGKKVKESVKPSVVTLKKHQPPDLAAARYWLNNRCPERWSDKPAAEQEDAFAAMKKLVESNEEAAWRGIEQKAEDGDS